jgi:hypothetical protein
MAASPQLESRMESTLFDFTVFTGGYGIFVYGLAKQIGESGWEIRDLVFGFIVGVAIAGVIGNATMGSEGAYITIGLAVLAGFLGVRNGTALAREKSARPDSRTEGQR